MRRAASLAAAIVALAAAVSTAAASLPSWHVGFASSSAIAPIPAEHFGEQYWQVAAVDPQTGSLILATLWDEGTTRASVIYLPSSGHGVDDGNTDLGPAAATDGGVSVRGFAIAHRGNSWTFRFHQNTTNVELRFAQVRPGPRASTLWHMGSGFRVGGWPNQPNDEVTFDWAVPVATASVSGALNSSQGSLSRSIRSWRGYIDHVWGHFDMYVEMHAWDAVAVESADGQAWMLQGFQAGPGDPAPNDSAWRGVLAHAGRGGAWACVAHVRRSGRLVAGLGGGTVLYFRRLTASCGGQRSAIFIRQRTFNATDNGAATTAGTSSGGAGFSVAYK